MSELMTWRNPRQIIERVVVKGELILQTPAHFGNGDPDPWSHVDMTLLRDPLAGKALLPGASLAGALRNYLRDLEVGYAVGYPRSLTGEEPAAETRSHKKRLTEKQERETYSVSLFGGFKGDDDGSQSLLIVDDALGEIGQLELREGVKIDPATRTAEEEKLFDMELLPAGTKFSLCFELLIPEQQTDRLLKALALALGGFEPGDGRAWGEITLGARKRRGFGRCKVDCWEVTRYNLTTGQGLIDWLDRDGVAEKNKSIAAALKIGSIAPLDVRHSFTLEADLALDGSLLIRSGFGVDDNAPDVVQLHVTQPDGTKKPVVPGTSLAGVLRQRALRIAQTLHGSKGAALVNQMFGCGNENEQDKETMTASRVIVEDAVVTGYKSMVQSRIKIDRFTGGAYETALFEEQPIFGNKTSRLTVRLTLRNPADPEIGLLLLVLKDLWTGDLPLGGESGIGRGRLLGQKAVLTLRQNGQSGQWTIAQAGEGLTVESPDTLQTYVNKLHQLQEAVV